MCALNVTTTDVPVTPGVSSSAMVPLLYHIVRVQRETSDTFTLEMEPQDGVGIAPFAPGQCNMLYVFGVGEVPISISGSPVEDGPLIHTIRNVGGVTRTIVEATQGRYARVRILSAPPFDSFRLRDRPCRRNPALCAVRME